MQIIPLLIFWFSLVFIFYTYLGYPLLLFCASFIFNQQRRVAVIKDLPEVSIVIAAKNEAENILRRLENLVEQDYPKEKVEVIVVSDGSTDDTAHLVQQFQVQRNQVFPDIRTISLPQAKGKPAALNCGVEAAKGEIIIFGDCRQVFDPQALPNLINEFSDERVGCVSGELIFRKTESSDIEEEMGIYWRYEKSIRKLESKVGSVVGVTGAIYAIRKTLYAPLPDKTILDDLYVPIKCYMQGKRVVFCSSAKAYDLVSDNVEKEWQRKVRTLAGNWQLFSLLGRGLSPLRFKLWWQFYSHKIARLLVPFLLPLLFLSNLFLAGEFYRTVLLLQVAAYLLLTAAVFVPNIRKIKLIALLYFFFVLNSAAVVGWWRWIRGSFSHGWK